MRYEGSRHRAAQAPARKKGVEMDAAESLADSSAHRSPVAGMAPRRAADTGPNGHIPALDGVRGAAILMVMIFHFSTSLYVLHVHVPMLWVLQFGWSGVDVFFTLSGFLITGILMDSTGAPHFFRDFYGRRALRIFPLYFGAIIVAGTLMLALPNAGVWGDTSSLASPGSLLWPAMFLENVAVTFRGMSATGMPTHFWSLAVEEHFYLLWPLLIWASRSPRQILAWAAIAAAASLAGRAILLMQGMHSADLARLMFLTPLRLDGLAIGAIAAVLVRTVGVGRLARPALAAMAASAMLLGALLVMRRISEQTDPELWLAAYPLMSLFTAATILTALGGGAIAQVLSVPLLRWFGRYSYGLYVWHPMINVLLLHSRLSPIARGAGPAAVLAVTGAALCLCLILAWGSYHFWEKGFLRLKRHLEPGVSGASPGAVSRSHQPPAARPNDELQRDARIAHPHGKTLTGDQVARSRDRMTAQGVRHRLRAWRRLVTLRLSRRR